ncbi:MAG: response regulator [Desulfuromonadales bacterium]|nr:response regulator [Desulfuromonadales bacterium]
MVYRTLIVEDEPAVRTLLALSAQIRGHEVLTFPGPTFCPLAIAKSCSLQVACSDILISDQMMPDMTGLEFLALLQEKHCPVRNKALVTAACSEQIRKKAEELGAIVIPKPFTVTAICDWLEECERKVLPDRVLMPKELLVHPEG